MISLSIEVDVEAIVEGFPHDEEAALKLIKALDVKFADYDFTKLLADHFAAEIAKEDLHDNPHPA
ncbi:MAG: hypothetical protein J0I77_17590 [Rudaea sp.]|uniref:hypothetical protein n=1 Tax=unclassified Rudaea TaxID=2627037 RepID=UPI0010F69732|nr:MULTISPECIES: hypothetical protein [unclassified Rudaea]MBN8887541.1 hypothetical protein [Rudaea sp.]